MKRLIVHPAHHEHLAAVVLLDDGTHQPVAVALEAGGHLCWEGGLRGCRGHLDILPCEPPGRRHQIHQCWICTC